MMISVLSFGFKYGIPEDADLVFDVRFLPNPYYVDELRPQTGMDEGVYNYVMDNETARQFAQKLEDMVEFTDSELCEGRQNKSGHCNRMYRRKTQICDTGKGSV